MILNDYIKDLKAFVKKTNHKVDTMLEIYVNELNDMVKNI